MFRTKGNFLPGVQSDPQVIETKPELVASKMHSEASGWTWGSCGRKLSPPWEVRQHKNRLIGPAFCTFLSCSYNLCFFDECIIKSLIQMKTKECGESSISHCPDPPKIGEGVLGLSLWMKPGCYTALNVAQLSQQKGEL